MDGKRRYHILSCQWSEVVNAGWQGKWVIPILRLYLRTTTDLSQILPGRTEEFFTQIFVNLLAKKKDKGLNTQENKGYLYNAKTLQEKLLRYC